MLEFWRAVGLDVSWKSTAVLAAVYAATLLLRRASASVRHMVWELALGSLLFLPALEVGLPAWRVSALPAGSAAVSEMRVVATADGTAAPSRRTQTQFPDRMAAAALAVWGAGALICLRRWKKGMNKVSQLRMQAERVVEDRACRLVRELAGQFRMRRQVALLRSAREIVPMAAGLQHPAVILPASSAHWTDERLRVVLVHEMAHIQRRDCLTQALAQLVSSLYWFNPLIWLALRRLRAERERACDDLVLSAGSRASDYAAHLLDLARSSETHDLSPSAICMSGASNLETRVQAILNPRLSRRAFTPIAGAAACLFAACLVLPLAAMRPQAGDARTVSGTVYDASGAVVPNASVILTNSDKSQKQTTTTDPAGQFAIGPLADGKYRVEVDAPGFIPGYRRFAIDGTRELHFDITVDLGSAEESVVVRGKGTPAPPPGKPHRIRVGGNVVPAKLLFQAKPQYPEDAKSRGVQGDVVLRAVISLEGTILSLNAVSSPDPQLTGAAMDAVRQWRYEPSLLNGKPVETATLITVNFQLEP